MKALFKRVGALLAIVLLSGCAGTSVVTSSPSPSTEVATLTPSPTPITPAPSMPEPLKATIRVCNKNGTVEVTAWVTNERQSPSGLIWFDVKTWAFDEGSIRLGKNAQKWYRLSDALYPSQPTWASIQGVTVQPLAKQKFMFTVIGGRSNLAVIGGVTIKASEGVFGDRVAFGYFSDELC